MSYDALFADLETTAHSRTATLRVVPAGENLSPEQDAALNAPFDQSAVVCAGAGSGKTRLLIQRAHALVTRGADPKRVLVVTFTKRAAKEISERLLARFGDKRRVPVCGTVHAIAMSMLSAEKLDVTLTTDDELTFFLDKLRGELPEGLLELSDKELLLGINRAREEEKDASTMGILATRLEDLLAEESAVDFTGLLQMGLSRLRGKFDYILVDESQDLSSLQRSFLKKIGRASCRYWFIGDTDQSIYRFRGAHGGVMEELVKEVGNRYILSVNYRSSPEIVNHALRLIQHNPSRFPIDWKAHRTDVGSVQVQQFKNGHEEAVAIRAWAQAAPEGQRMALCRTRAMMEALRMADIPALTVHQSKGLEWDDVWVAGAESVMFPHAMGTPAEERRLFYVAMTRARRNLTLSYCLERERKQGSSLPRAPSEFLYEMQGL